MENGERARVKNSACVLLKDDFLNLGVTLRGKVKDQ